MGTFVRGQVVVLPFPYSDLTEAKPRPALILADLGSYNDLILCMITAKRSDPFCVEITNADFESGGLPQAYSYVRVYRLFTAHATTVKRTVGQLKQSKIDEIMAQLFQVFA